MSDQYTPVSCQLHSELELAIIRQRNIILVLKDPPAHHLTVTPLDILTDHRQEFLVVNHPIQKQLNIRLDNIESLTII